ncbi:MAG: hypothetical protein M1827_005080 [Pycnora praestabilis]|nr:MAG: hypothetical protein M1827_005080 [Pycnora praestabilis]
MAEQPNITAILAALAAQRPGGTPSQATPQPGLPQGYSSMLTNSTPPAGLGGFGLPQPSNSGSLDLSSIKPSNSGSVSIADAIAKARGIAAQKGVSYDIGRGSGTPNRDSDPRLVGRPYRRSRSRSRSPPPARRDNFRDNYNPYRDERRDDRRGETGRDFGRERSFSPGSRGRVPVNTFSPPPSRGFGGRGDRSPPGRGSGGEGDNVETIMIDSGLVGLIIGRQGENLRRVETDTGTRVQFITGPDATGPSRHCKITGSRAARADAKAEIYRIIDENGNGPKAGALQLDRNARGSSGGSNKPAAFGSGHQPALRDGEDSMQIMVPDRTVGLIIGRGGETIRDLQERSGCHVNIVGEQKSVNGLRPVNLIGSAQAAAMAKELIMEIVDSDTKSLAAQGPPARDAGRGGGYGGFGGGGGDGYGGGVGGGGDKINDTIIVPSEAVGMIIGKGGETIKDMQNTTGCKINVSAVNTGANDYDREIGLVGSRNSIEQAKNAIMEKVEAVQQKNRGGGGGGGRIADPYSDRDRYSQSQQPQQSYGQQSAGMTPQSQVAVPPAGGDAVDPYAAYGGYQNYLVMWYAAVAQQQQQGQGQGEQPRPPGTA